MGKTRGVHETTPELRNRMVGMYEAGLGLREIAAAVNCSQRTVKRWLNRFDKEGTVETRERCGRKRATTSEQDEAIVRLATQTSITAAKAVLPMLGLTCSVDTVRERLHKAGIHNWSPSRKYMQRIPLGDADGAAIQQAVWRPTGTQLGKKKVSTDSNKVDKVTTSKKKSPSKKAKSRNTFAGDGAPSEIPKQATQQEDCISPQQNLPEAQPNEIQHPSVPPPVTVSLTEFSNALCLAPQPQPVYQHPVLNIGQSWPLDLVQGAHHYPQDQPSSLSPEESAPQLQELHSQQERPHHLSQHLQQRLPDQRATPQTTTQSHNIDQQQPQVEMEHQIPLQPQSEGELKSQLSNSPINSSISSNSSDSCNPQENERPSSDSLKRKRKSARQNSDKQSQLKKKKKGGKAKGTLETSVEIRNRMIGMAEAGLSTLSIALAIDRSERTVKRWLERWHKEGNVQTKERKGRRRITTKEQDEAIVAMATQHPLTAAKYVAPALGLTCSVDTIRERLHKAGIHSWKLGKKQGEGNAVHTVHLWQPSGNRPNKPKPPAEKRKKPVENKKRNQNQIRTTKPSSHRKKKSEDAPIRFVPIPSHMILDPMSTTTTATTTTAATTIPFHNPGTMATYVSAPNIMQPVHNLAGPPAPTLVHPQSTLAEPASAVPPPPPPPRLPGPQPMQPMGPIMQQRPDCRLAPTIVPAVSLQGPAAVPYPSCMVASNSDPGHMEQADPLNYEPYIWSF